MISDSSIINIVYITDEGFSMPTTVSIASLICNSKKDNKIRIYVFCDGLTEEDKKRILELATDNCEIQCIDIKEKKYKFLKDKTELCIKHVSYTAAFKFELPQILNEEKIIYIDGDTVIQNDISELWNLDMSNKSILAVDDQLDTYENGKSQLASGINVDSQHYFNSGVMVMDLEKMRQSNRTQQLVDYRINGQNRYMDQDAFNAVMKDDILPIDIKYNFLIQITDFYDLDELNSRYRYNEKTMEAFVSRALILHFAGPIKPWVYNRPWFTEIFMKYYRMTSYRENIELKSPLKRLNDDKDWLKSELNYYKKNEWVFPYERIKKGSNVVIWGAGAVGNSFVRQLKHTEYCNIQSWVDNNKTTEEISNPGILYTLDYDYVIVATINQNFMNEIRGKLINDFKCDDSKIITVI